MKVSEEIVPFQQAQVRILNLEMRCKHDSIELPVLDKKNPTPNVLRNLTPPKNS